MNPKENCYIQIQMITLKQVKAKTNHVSTELNRQKSYSEKTVTRKLSFQKILKIFKKKKDLVNLKLCINKKA